jgi:P63C domain
MAKSKKELSDHARALSAKGASKGGNARAEQLTPDERQTIARNAAQARWGETIPRASYNGHIDIAERVIDCAVLENGTRLLTQQTFLKAIGRSRSAKGGTGSSRLSIEKGMPPFLIAENLQPFITNELRSLTNPITFKTARNGKAFGYEATLLPRVCEVYLKARDASTIAEMEGRRLLTDDQKRIASVCDLLMRGLAQVGIIALVDAATGYEKQREKDELNKILSAYINEELRPWVKGGVFPESFFEQIYRVYGWTYTPGNISRPQVIGNLINKWIYEQLPDGILEDLQKKNPVNEAGNRNHRHHQHLTESVGLRHLEGQIAVVTSLLRVSDTKEDFERLFAKNFNKPYQNQLPLEAKSLQRL